MDKDKKKWTNPKLVNLAISESAKVCGYGTAANGLCDTGGSASGQGNATGNPHFDS